MNYEVENSMVIGRDRFSHNYGNDDGIGYCDNCEECIHSYDEYKDLTYYMFCDKYCMNEYFEKIGHKDIEFHK